MFAAAAVAAAAALTAISTTSAASATSTNPAADNSLNKQYERPKPYISWTQYAMQRRNSLQRRKIEISRRLEKASANNNNPNNRKDYSQNSNNPNNANYNNNNNNNKKTFHQFDNPQTRNYSTYQANAFGKIPTNSLNLDNNNNNNLSNNIIYKNQYGLNEGLNDEEFWLNDLSKNVCNEFIRFQKIHSDINDTNNNQETIDFTNPTYKKFNLIGSLGATSFFDDKQPFDINDISNALLDYLQSQNIPFLPEEYEYYLDDLNNIYQNELSEQYLQIGAVPNNNQSDRNKLISQQINQQSYHAHSLGGHQQQQQLQQQQQQQLTNRNCELLTYRWDPKWLKTIRKSCCIPVAIITLFFLLFTNISSNWIYFEGENQRAGLWSICNKTKIEQQLEFNDVTSTASNSLKYLISNEFNGTSSLIKKLKKTKIFFDKSNDKFEDCYSKFFLKEDSHLAIVSLSLVGLLFHFVGLVLLFIGIFFSTSNRSLYFYHSAGECLVTSALVNGLDLIAFVSVASSQLEQSFKLGYCFYINIIISLITFFSSLIFHLDDIVNEYRVWKIKTSEQNRISRIYAPT